MCVPSVDFGSKCYLSSKENNFFILLVWGSQDFHIFLIKIIIISNLVL